MDFHCDELIQLLKPVVVLYWQSTVPAATAGACVGVVAAAAEVLAVVATGAVVDDDCEEDCDVGFVEAAGRVSTKKSAAIATIATPVLMTVHKLRRKKFLGLSFSRSGFGYS